jgi:hypothetical protein
MSTSDKIGAVIGLSIIFALIAFLVGIRVGQQVYEKTGILEGVNGVTIMKNTIIVNDPYNTERIKSFEVDKEYLNLLRRSIEKKVNVMESSK